MEMPLAIGKYDLCELVETFLNGWFGALVSNMRFISKWPHQSFILNHGFIGSCWWFVDAVTPNAGESHVTRTYRNLIQFS